MKKKRSLFSRIFKQRYLEWLLLLLYYVILFAFFFMIGMFICVVTKKSFGLKQFVIVSFVSNFLGYTILQLIGWDKLLERLVCHKYYDEDYSAFEQDLRRQGMKTDDDHTTPVNQPEKPKTASAEKPKKTSVSQDTKVMPTRQTQSTKVSQDTKVYKPVSKDTTNSKK